MNSIERVSLAESDGSASDSSFSRWIERPVRFVCMLTIPTSEADKWNRNFASVNPTCGYFVFLISIDSKSLFFVLIFFSCEIDLNFYDQKVLLGLLVSVVLGLAIRFGTRATEAPNANIFCIFQLASFFMSLMWI